MPMCSIKDHARVFCLHACAQLKEVKGQLQKLQPSYWRLYSVGLYPRPLSLFHASVFMWITTKFMGLWRNLQDYEEISGITKKFT